MSIFNFFKKKNERNPNIAREKPKLDVGIFDIWANEREEFENYFKSFKRPIQESLIPSSKFFKDSICPYCGFKLNKSPLKKTKCPHCQNYIYIRTNFITKEKMLLTKEQVNKLETENIEIGTKVVAERTVLSDYYNWIEFKKIKEELKKENKKIDDFDILWGILNKKQVEYVKQNNWGLYRNTCYGMFAIMNAENRFKEALGMALEICYYDINGPNNLSSTNTTILKEFPPFNPESGLIAPALVYSIRELKEKLALQWEDVKNMFIDRANQKRINIMPIFPQKAWEILYDELYNGLD